ncbi:hypothetical protein [Micromonospora sp. NPDC005203]
MGQTCTRPVHRPTGSLVSALNALTGRPGTTEELLGLAAPPRVTG